MTVVIFGHKSFFVLTYLFTYFETYRYDGIYFDGILSADFSNTKQANLVPPSVIRLRMQ